MRSKLTLVLGILCCCLAVSSIVLWREWTAQVESTTAATTARAESEARNRQLTAQLTALRRGSADPEGAPRNDARALESGSSAAPGDPANTERPTPYPEAFGFGGPGGRGPPGMQGMRGGNRNLIANLHLNETEAEKLNRLLNERQAQARQIGQQNGGPPDRKVMAEFRKETDRQVQSLLGDSKYGEYEDYFRNVEEHMRVAQLERRMQETGMSALSGAQQTQLFDLLREEKALIPAPVREAYATAQQYRAAENAWEADYEQRISARASSLLSSEQLTLFSRPQRGGRRRN